MTLQQVGEITAISVPSIGGVYYIFSKIVPKFYKFYNNHLATVEEIKKIEVLKNQISALIFLYDEPMFLCDKKGQCVLVNQLWQDITGMSNDEAEGVGWVDAVFKEDRDRIISKWDRAIKNNSIFHDDSYRLENQKNGTLTTVNCTTIISRNDKKEIISILGKATIINK